MRRQLRSFTIATALALSAGTAGAAPCYMLFDRFDNVVYRNSVSPIDLSEQGASARAALRQRGEYLLVMESERCPPVTFLFGAAGSKALTLDESVGGFPPESPASASARRRRPAASVAAPATAPGSSK